MLNYFQRKENIFLQPSTGVDHTETAIDSPPAQLIRMSVSRNYGGNQITTGAYQKWL